MNKSSIAALKIAIDGVSYSLRKYIAAARCRTRSSGGYAGLARRSITKADRPQGEMKLQETFMRLMILCLAVALLAAGCSGKKAKDPQLINLRLTNDLIESLAKDDHKTALAQTVKLRTVLPESSFLSQLEESEISNIYIKQAQPLLDRGDLEGTAKVIERGLKDHPMNRYLLRCKQQLEQLGEFRKVIGDTLNPLGAASLRTAIAKLKTLSAAYPQSTFVTQLIADKEQQAAAMEKQEIRRAYDSLIYEYRILSETEPALAGVLAAEIAYEKDNIEASRQ